MKRSKLEYENELRSRLVGKRLRGVRYYEIQYDAEEPYYST